MNPDAGVPLYPIRVEQCADDPNRWLLLTDLTYRARWETFRVPAGFTTDFASVPRVLWWLVPPYASWLWAALVHDWLWAESEAGRFTKNDADGVFRRALREAGVRPLQRWVMWSIVRAASGPRSVVRGDHPLVAVGLAVVAVGVMLPVLAVLAVIRVLIEGVDRLSGLFEDPSDPFR